MMTSCNCCPYGFHIYLDFVQYCETQAKNRSTNNEHESKRIKRRCRKSKIDMLGFENVSKFLDDNLLDIKVVDAKQSFFTCYPHEKNEFVNGILNDIGKDMDRIFDLPSKCCTNKPYQYNNTDLQKTKNIKFSPEQRANEQIIDRRENSITGSNRQNQNINSNQNTNISTIIIKHNNSNITNDMNMNNHLPSLKVHPSIHPIPKPSAICRNAFTMTTPPISRDIGITTTEIRHRTIGTNTNSTEKVIKHKSTGNSIGTQTQKISEDKPKTEQIPCEKCSLIKQQGKISLKNLDNIDQLHSANIEKEMSLVNLLQNNIKPKLVTKAVNTDNVNVVKSNKSCWTDRQLKSEIGINTDRPPKTIDRGTYPVKIEQNTVACGEDIRPHILISCADNYCDSCKDIVKNLAEKFMSTKIVENQQQIVEVNANSLTKVPVLMRQDTYSVENSNENISADDELTELLESFQPTNELKEALKIIDNELTKKEIPKLNENIKSLIEDEWFKISSSESSQVNNVNSYINNFKSHSNSLLKYMINLSDKNRNTAMHYAISHGNLDIAASLLNTNVCDVNLMNSAGYTCGMLVSLTNLCHAEHFSVVKRLFNLTNVNLCAKNHGQTALMIAVSHGNTNMIQILLECGADVNVQDEDGSTALMCAAEHGFIEIVKLLLSQPECNSTIQDCDGSTALKISLEAGYRDIGILLYAHERIFRKKGPVNLSQLT